MTAFVKWRDDWLLGIDKLDAQHRALADCLNRLAAAAGNGGEVVDTEAIRSLITELYTRTKQHFRYEEDLMHKAGYPGYADHAREHAMLLAELKSTITHDLSAEPLRLPPDLLSALRSWLIVHILQSDREFAEYFFSGGDNADSGEAI